MSSLFEKKYFYSKCVNICHINALRKDFENQILHGSRYFSCLKNSKTIINFENESIPQMLNVLWTFLLIVRSFIKVWKQHCWNNSGWYHGN